MRKTTIILLILLAVCMWLACVALQPVGGRPKISISFLGYTNDATGTRLAMIAVANLAHLQFIFTDPLSRYRI